VEDAPDGVGTDAGQPVWSETECSLQDGERPRRRLVLVAIRCPTNLPQDALLFGDAVALWLTATVSELGGSQPFPVEPSDQLCHSIATLATRRMARFGEAVASGYREQGFGSSDLGSGRGVRAAEVFQLGKFVGAEGAQGILLTAWHERAPGRLDGDVQHHLPSLDLSKATPNRTDPLVSCLSI